MKTYHAIFGEAISDSITQAVIKSQMTAEIRTHLELQSFSRTAELVSLMSSLSKIGTTTTCPKAAALGPVPMESGWVKNKEKRRKEKARAKEKAKKSQRARSSRCGVTIAEHGVTKLLTVFMEKRNRCTRYKAKLALRAQM